MGSQWLYVGDLAIKRRKFCCCVLVSAIRRVFQAAAVQHFDYLYPCSQVRHRQG